MKAQLPKHQRRSLGTPGCRERGERGERGGGGVLPPTPPPTPRPLRQSLIFFWNMIPTTSLSNLSEFYGTGFESLRSRTRTSVVFIANLPRILPLPHPSTLPRQTAVCIRGESDSDRRLVSLMKHSVGL